MPQFPFSVSFLAHKVFFLLRGGKGKEIYMGRGRVVFCPLLAREIVPAAIKNPPPGKGDKKWQRKGLRETHGGFPLSPRKNKK